MFQKPLKIWLLSNIIWYSLQTICKKAPYKVQFLEKRDGNRRAAHHTLDASVTSKRKENEKEWISQLRTIFVYGLNNWLVDDFEREDTHVFVGSKFSV